MKVKLVVEEQNVSELGRMRECGNEGEQAAGSLCFPLLLLQHHQHSEWGQPRALWPWPVATLLDNGDGRYHQHHHSLDQHHHGSVSYLITLLS